MTDLRQTPQYASYMKSQGWIAEAIRLKPSSQVFCYIKRLPFFPFSVMKVQRFEVFSDLDLLLSVARQYRCISVTLEPGLSFHRSEDEINQFLSRYHFRPARWPLLPSKTLEVNLKRSHDTLFLALSKDAKSSVNKSRRLCTVRILEHREAEFLSRFYAFWRQHGRGYIPSRSEFFQLLSSFKNRSFVVTVSKKKDDSDLLAGTVILQSDKSAYYYYAFVSSLGRKSSAGYLALWESMMESKRRLSISFDFEGIYDDRYPRLKRWKGFSFFKKKFGGDEVLYPGVYTRYLFPGL